MIEENIKRIRESVYGRDVRESIADGLEKAYADSNANTRMEVITARGSYESLGERLDAIDTEITNDQNTYNRLEEEISKLEQQIFNPVDVLMETRRLDLNTDVWHSGDGSDQCNIAALNQATLPIFDLVENPDSLLAIIYSIDVEQKKRAYFSFPAYIRLSDTTEYTTGYTAKTIGITYTDSNTGCMINGTSMNYHSEIDTTKRITIVNEHHSETLRINEVMAFILTK